MDTSSLDRLVLLTFSDSQGDLLMKQLTKEDFRLTVINSTGGLLQEAVVCLLVGFPHERMPLFLDIVRKNCHAFRKYIPTQGVMPMEQVGLPMVEAQLGGATIYTMNVVRFVQI
jgi:uncharacterized protein YaaQ